MLLPWENLSEQTKDADLIGFGREFSKDNRLLLKSSWIPVDVRDNYMQKSREKSMRKSNGVSINQDIVNLLENLLYRHIFTRGSEDSQR